MTSLFKTLRTSRSYEVVNMLQGVLDCARDHAKRTTGANPYVTTVAYDTAIDAPVVVVRAIDSDNKPLVLAAYRVIEHRRRTGPPGVIIRHGGFNGQPGVTATYTMTDAKSETMKYYDFEQIVGDRFARIANEDFAVKIAHLPFELSPLMKAVPELYEGEHRDLAEVMAECRRDELARAFFERALNEANIALMARGARPFANWREFFAASVNDHINSGEGEEPSFGVSQQDCGVLTDSTDAETTELRTKLGYPLRLSESVT